MARNAASQPYDLAAARRAIRAECGKQAIDDDARRAMMRRLAGVDSSTQLNADGARKVLDHLRKAASPPRAKPANALPALNSASRGGEWAWANAAPKDKQDLIWKVRRLCIEIGIKSGVQVAYSEGVAARLFGMERHLPMMTAGEIWKLIGPLERTLASKPKSKTV